MSTLNEQGRRNFCQILVKKTVPKAIRENEVSEIKVLRYFIAYKFSSVAAGANDFEIAVSPIHRILSKYKMRLFIFHSLNALMRCSKYFQSIEGLDVGGLLRIRSVA